MSRSCGTCVHWSDEDFGGFRQCEWQLPVPVPFWAHVSRGTDHDDCTSAEQGTRCRTWKARESGS